MLKDTKVPKPEEESDEPVIAGEARYTRKKGAAGLGEYIGMQRQQELAREDAKRKRELEPFKQQFIAKEEVAASFAAQRQQKRTEQESVRQRRLAEQAEQDQRQSSLHTGSRYARQLGTSNAAGQSQEEAKKELDELKQKFYHAKIELEKEKRNETSAVNKLRNESKTLETRLASEQRELERNEREKKQGLRATDQTERDIDELQQQERELATAHGTLTAKQQSELRQVRTKISNLNFKQRLSERSSFAAAGSSRRDQTTFTVAKNRLKDLQKEIGEHESRLSMVEDLLREWQSKQAQRDLPRVWREYELDLRNKLGIHIYR